MGTEPQSLDPCRRRYAQNGSRCIALDLNNGVDSKDVAGVSTNNGVSVGDRRQAMLTRRLPF
jgi:hypothetical protein